MRKELWLKTEKPTMPTPRRLPEYRQSAIVS
jgi:hypothetical protein